MTKKNGNGKETQQGLFTSGPPPAMTATLADEAQRRYLNYALSVITARALPDVRDGLKPVQRRILYAMSDLGLRPDAKYRKCALIVGEVLGKYHPHGDSSVYDALVRLAQDFTMRAMLIDGRGNFGSADGDSAAAYRYTEAKLQKLAMELLAELDRETVSWRPNFDNTRNEPIVLPARFPSLLVNGSQGIAVGMATSIPPHNLGEVIDASVALIDEPELTTKQLLKYIKGPDFPTGGQLVATKTEIAEAYSTGSGSLKLRGEWKLEETGKTSQIVITSIPYALERGNLVEKIAEVIISKKLSVLTGIRDESDANTRVVLDIKKDTDPQLVMAYLYKHTPLSTSVQVNLTCLVPIPGSDICAPERLELRAMLKHFLAFRLEVVTRRLRYDLAALKKRIHILDGFVIIFDALDETIRIIRKSEGKRDAAEKIMKRFGLDEEQTDAILELRLYRLAQLEINVIREELAIKKKEANRLETLLKSEPARWKLVRAEMLELKDTFNDRRRTKITGSDDAPEFDADAFIVDEDSTVILTEQGWVKRQRELKDASTTRVRDGDRVMEVVLASTKACVAFFSSRGVCYVSRVADIPQTTGYGDPLQKSFKLEDGEKIVAMLSFDPRSLEVPPAPNEDEGSEPQPPFGIGVSRKGFTMRFSLRGHREPSTRSGRKYARVVEGDEILFVSAAERGPYVACATADGHALVCEVDEVPVLAGPGKGVMLVKLGAEDHVVGATVLVDDVDTLVVEDAEGKRKFEIGKKKSGLSSRGGKGGLLFKRGAPLARVVLPEVTLPGALSPDA